MRLVNSAVPLTLHVCTAGGVSWAVASADLVEPALVGPALIELVASAKANLVGQAIERSPFSVNGGTPNADAVRELVVGKLPDGQVVREHVGVFARATWAVQITALGAAPPPEAVATFFESVHVRP